MALRGCGIHFFTLLMTSFRLQCTLFTSFLRLTRKYLVLPLTVRFADVISGVDESP